jgi:hypothetical protein
MLASSAQRTIKNAEEICEGKSLAKTQDPSGRGDRTKHLRAKREARLDKACLDVWLPKSQRQYVS